MAQSQLLSMNVKNRGKFDSVDITVNDHMSITVDESFLKIRQKDISGRCKSCTFTKENWFELMNFVNIINSLFLLKYQNNDYIIPYDYKDYEKHSYALTKNNKVKK